MRLTVPVLVRKRRVRGVQLHHVRPLFFPCPEAEHERLERALQLFVADLRKLLRNEGKEARHDGIASRVFNPPLETQRVSLECELRRRMLRVRPLVVHFEALGRRVAFCTAFPEVWFEVVRGDNVADRAHEVLTAHFRDLEKEDEEFSVPEELNDDETSWITPVELSADLEQNLEKEKLDFFALLGGGEEVDGYTELRRVGRCLDDLYPDELDRVLLRDPEAEELMMLLARPERRPVLILGPRLVGKTALLHEVVWRRAAARSTRDRYRDVGRTWLLSPQRLISGMSYVGQWENRLLAILAEARKREHVLYFDDLIGLYQAGQTCNSTLSAAQVLKPYLERGEVRLVAEMTPEQLRVLRERDRGLADLFTVVPLRAPGEIDNLRVLLAVQRQLEARHQVRFNLDVLAAAIDLQRRHARDQAFPGKAAVFLRRLAVKYRHETISRPVVLLEFHEQTGLSIDLIDPNRRINRERVLDALSDEIVGQPAALEAAADVIGIAKARLSDPDRPLASFLFLGPTGVGKTQCAKAIARFLFGDAERLVRFDMNEMVEPGAAARLAGTFDQPEGLLTAAVRRRPFSVVLLDEIEKAHPEVFDLLLQVLGEGRLTDALGRTVDFSGTLIILTSNLGVREAQQTFGLTTQGHRREAYAEAARRFFRPELYNRLDRIVPFERLGRQELERIARALIEGLLTREGLVRRKCVLHVEPEAMTRIVERGHDPMLGARALKRAVEQELARPVGAQLAEGLPHTITVLSVYPRGDGVATHVTGLTEVDRLPPRRLGDTASVLDGVARALRRIEGQFAHLRPRGEISAATLGGEHELYFLVTEQVRELRGRLKALKETWEDSTVPAASRPVLPPSARVRTLVHRPGKYDPLPPLLHEIATAEDIGHYFDELSQRAEEFSEANRRDLLDLAESAALLDLLASSSDRPHGEQVLLYLWSPVPAGAHPVRRQFLAYHDEGFLPGRDERTWWGLEGERVPFDHPWPSNALVVRGLAAGRLTAFEVGTHLYHTERAGLVPVFVHALPLADGASAEDALAGLRQKRADWLAAVSRDEATFDQTPLPALPVVRVYDRDRRWVDVRTGRIEDGTPSVPALVLAGLPFPAELEGPAP